MKYYMPLDGSQIDYIFAPFHDPDHSPWLPVEIEAKNNLEVARDTLWDSTTISWGQGNDTASFILYIHTPFEAITHDQLVVCLNFPTSAQVELSLLSKNLIGKNNSITGKWSSPFIGKGVRQEIVCDVKSLMRSFTLIPRKKKFSGIAIRLTSQQTDLRILSMNWLGMRNSTAHALIEKLQAAKQLDWSPWILPSESWGKIHFERGLLFDETALTSVREKLGTDAWKQHFTIIETRAKEYLKRNPEESFGEYLPTHDERYIRQSQHGHTAYHWESLVLAFVGLVNEDKAMIKHALRYLMCMLHTRFWTESGEHNTPSSSWNHLSFMEEMTTTSVAILTDWLGYAIAPRTKILIRKVLWEKGIAPVMRDLSWRDSMHQMNQGAVFNRAIILGGLMLEDGWTRFDRKIVDNAYNSMCDVLNHYIKSDGGIHEGIGYLAQTMTAVLWTTIAYCRGRGLDWVSEVKKRFYNIDRYARVMSSMKPGKAIPSEDCRVGWFSGDMIPILALVFPNSSFSDILNNCLTTGWVHELSGTLAKSGGLIGMVYGPDKVKESCSIIPKYDHLPKTGKVSLSFGGDNLPTARLWISGSTKDATHSHRDIGQFVMEIEGNEIFIDRGMLQYWFVEAHFLSHSWLHNVLTPIADDGSYINQVFPTSSDLISVSDDHSKISVPGNGIWSDHMVQYTRHFSINDTMDYSVIDKFNLSRPCRLAFHLHSPFEFRVSDKKAEITQDGYRVEVLFPWAESVSCKQVLVDLLKRPVFHLCAKSPIQKDHCTLETVVNIL